MRKSSRISGQANWDYPIPSCKHTLGKKCRSGHPHEPFVCNLSTNKRHLVRQLYNLRGFFHSSTPPAGPTPHVIGSYFRSPRLFAGSRITTLVGGVFVPNCCLISQRGGIISKSATVYQHRLDDDTEVRRTLRHLLTGYTNESIPPHSITFLSHFPG